MPSSAPSRPVAVDLDGVLGDTGALWRAWLDDAERRYRVELGPGDTAVLDERLGNWPALLERFAEDHAPVYLRPNAEVSAALRRLRAAGASIVAVSAAPEPLARVALAHLAARLVDRLASTPPDGAVVVRTRDELLVQSWAWTEGT
jgi:phosphoglycolate phosphatase-like HAD superfamily hydrolase